MTLKLSPDLDNANGSTKQGRNEGMDLLREGGKNFIFDRPLKPQYM